MGLSRPVGPPKRAGLQPSGSRATTTRVRSRREAAPSSRSRRGAASTSMPLAALHSNSEPELLEGGVASGQCGIRASEVAEEMVEAESSLRLGGSASPAVQSMAPVVSMAPVTSMATGRTIAGGGTHCPGICRCGGTNPICASCRDSREPSDLASCNRACVGRPSSRPPNDGRDPARKVELPNRRRCCTPSWPKRAVRGRSAGGRDSVGSRRGGSLDSPRGWLLAKSRERRAPACRSGRSARRRAARSAALCVWTRSRRRPASRRLAGVPGAP